MENYIAVSRMLCGVRVLFSFLRKIKLSFYYSYLKFILNYNSIGYIMAPIVKILFTFIELTCSLPWKRFRSDLNMSLYNGAIIFKLYGLRKRPSSNYKSSIRFSWTQTMIILFLFDKYGCFALISILFFKLLTNIHQYRRFLLAWKARISPCTSKRP